MPISRSKARVQESKKFREVEDDIRRYLEIKDRKLTPLKKEKFFANYQRKLEKETTVGSVGVNSTNEPVDGSAIVRDFYLNEVLTITRDLASAIRE